MIVAIVGSRKGLDWQRVRDEVERIISRAGVGTVVSGGALGVDRMAETVALARGKRVQVFYPDWRNNGRSAGFMRNQQIVDIADEVYALWDGQSRGTADTIARAKKAGKPVFIVECGERAAKGDGA